MRPVPSSATARSGFRARLSPLILGTALTLLACERSAPAQPAKLRAPDLARDPGWESFRCRLLPNRPQVTRQDFGWQPGRIGGTVQRSLRPACFSMAIAPRSLDSPLRATGKFHVRRDDGGSGTLFGFFHETSRGWRTPNSLALRLDGNGGKYWVFYEYGTRHGRTGGEGCFEGDRYQTTPTKPFPSNGSEHTWSLVYEPRAAGDGLIRFTLDGKSYTTVMPAEHRAEGAQFNRFGLINQQASGSDMEVWFSELTLDGQPIDLSSAGGWKGEGNQTEFSDHAVRPFHDFGWSAKSRLGARGGEMGGLIWRDEKPAFYADRIGPLSLRDELFASGRIALHSAGADSALVLGWFDSASKSNKSTPQQVEPQRNVLAVLIEGPSRVGHYFRPLWQTSGKAGHLEDTGAIIQPDGRAHRWSLHYKPQAAGGRGEVTVTLDAATQTVALPAGHRDMGAHFDRFGICNLQVGGLHVDFSLDELRYTEAPMGR